MSKTKTIILTQYLSQLRREVDCALQAYHVSVEHRDDLADNYRQAMANTQAQYERLEELSRRCDEAERLLHTDSRRDTGCPLGAPCPSQEVGEDGTT